MPSSMKYLRLLLKIFFNLNFGLKERDRDETGFISVDEAMEVFKLYQVETKSSPSSRHLLS